MRTLLSRERVTASRSTLTTNRKSDASHQPQPPVRTGPSLPRRPSDTQPHEPPIPPTLRGGAAPYNTKKVASCTEDPFLHSKGNIRNIGSRGLERKFFPEVLPWLSRVPNTGLRILATWISRPSGRPWTTSSLLPGCGKGPGTPPDVRSVDADSPPPMRRWMAVRGPMAVASTARIPATRRRTEFEGMRSRPSGNASSTSCSNRHRIPRRRDRPNFWAGRPAPPGRIELPGPGYGQPRRSHQ